MYRFAIPLLTTGFLAALAAAGFAVFGGMFSGLHGQIIQPSGRIELRVTNSACAALSPQSDTANPLELNDGKLNEVENTALLEGCVLQATAIAPNGMRLTDVPLALLRAESLTGDYEIFDRPRRTDDYGTATWVFPLTPNTRFTYQAMSPNPVGRSVRSNEVEIQLCTGPDSVRLFQGIAVDDVGRGCPP